MPVAALAAVALGGLWLCLWRRRWRLLGLVPIAAGFLAVPLSQPPDILVDGEAKLFAVRAGDGGLMLSSNRAARFSAKRWLLRDGRWEAEPWPEEGASAGGWLTCDRLGCLYLPPGESIAIVLDPRALDDDCRTAALIVSAVPVRGPCPSARAVIDRFDLWREGAHAIWLEDGGARIESVTDWQGARPWAPRRGP